MRETGMQSPDKCLLPLRRKTSPPTVLNTENHATVKGEGDVEITKVAGKRERLFSASSRSVSSVSSSKYDSSLAPPFTPPVNNCETQGHISHDFTWRRPSEHFLEVLEAENKVEKTVPKTLSKSLPPLRKTNERKASLKTSLGETKIAFEGSVCKGASFNPVESRDGQLILLSESKKELITPIYTNGKILRKTNSLPLIRTCSALTNGLTDLNVSCHRNRTKSAILGSENTFNESKNTFLPLEENVEDANDENCDCAFNDDTVESASEKFTMICHWLKECEKAKVT